MSLTIWPAIDLLDGAAVRLHQGNYDEVTVYDRDPAAIARRWRDRTRHLHVVDLDGARRGLPAQLDAVRQLVSAFGPGVQVGGGVRTMATVAAYFDAGAERVVLGTACIKNPSLVREAASRYPGCVVLAVDAKDGLVATEGWTELSTTLARDLVNAFSDLPLAAVLYTDIARDGTGVGPNLDATEALAQATGRPVLASGGVGSLDHVRALARRAAISAVVIGKALHDGVFTLEEALAAAARPPS